MLLSKAKALSLGPKNVRRFSSANNTSAGGPQLLQTQLSKGGRVISIDGPTDLATVGTVVLQGGPRSESQEIVGASHFIRHLGFKGNKILGTSFVRRIESLGANYSVSSTRENISYVATAERLDFPDLLFPQLADALACVTRDQWELDEAREKVDAEVHNVSNCARTTLFEALHAEVYKHRGLGNPLFCPENKVASMKIPDVLAQILGTNVHSSFAVIGVGVDHKKLVEQAEKYILTDASVFLNESGKIKISPSRSPFVGGGDARIRFSGNQHVAVAWEGASASAEKRAVFAVLSNILGGGDAYAQKPGNGVLSRLNQGVVRKNGGVRYASSFDFNYSDSGVFGAYVEFNPTETPAVYESLVNTLRGFLSGDVSEVELNRAKNAAALNVLLQNQTQASLVDFLSAQLTTESRNTPVLPAHQAAQIRSVTLAQVKNALSELASKAPSTVSLGPNIGAVSPVKF